MNRYIDSEIILTRKIKYIVYVYVMIIIIMLLSLIIAFMLLDYKTYYKLRGLVIKDDSSYYIKLYIPLDNIKFITNNNIIIIDKSKLKIRFVFMLSQSFHFRFLNPYLFVSLLRSKRPIFSQDMYIRLYLSG